MNAHNPSRFSPLQHALAYANRGWRVFPCNPLTKRPITRNGHLDASVDPDTIRKWWVEFPNAMIGCATGPESGFWVLDADRDEVKGVDGVAALAQLGESPETVEQTTPRGGVHKLFRWDSNRPVRNSASKIGLGIDTRGDGGYVILAGSVRNDGAMYQWSISPENGEIREAPDWLYEEIRKARVKSESPSGLGQDGDFPFDLEPVTREAAKIFREQCLKLAAAGSGSRNDTLNKTAFTIGRLIGLEEISLARAREGLMWAAEQCDLIDDDGESRVEATLKSGLSAGIEDGRKANPREWHETVPSEALDAWSRPASQFAGKAIPPQRWLVEGFIPARTVTLLYGDGGTGKSLLALQLAFGASALGTWLGMNMTRGSALFVTAEDEDEELHRRLAAIASGSGYMLEELHELHLRSLSGQDAVLAAPSMKTGLMEVTKVFAALKAEILRLRPVVVVLDTLADLFGGDEIKRIQARQFIQLLQSLIAGVDFDVSIVLLAHPSLSGMSSGSGTSGNTAWSNSVRSRLYLERRILTRGEKQVEPDTDCRVLSTKKANRTKLGGEVALRWSGGRFVLEGVSVAEDAAEDRADEAAFLTMLAQANKAHRFVSSNAPAPSYAPRQFAASKAGEAIGKMRLAAAMERLFEQAIIELEPYGPASRRYYRIIEASKPPFQAPSKPSKPL